MTPELYVTMNAITATVALLAIAISLWARYDERRPTPVIVPAAARTSEDSEWHLRGLNINLINAGVSGIPIVGIGISTRDADGIAMFPTSTKTGQSNAGNSARSFGPEVPCALPAHSVLTWGADRDWLDRVVEADSAEVVVEWYGRSRWPFVSGVSKQRVKLQVDITRVKPGRTV